MEKFEENELFFFLDIFKSWDQTYNVFFTDINHRLEECSSYKLSRKSSIFDCYLPGIDKLHYIYEEIKKHYYNDKANNYIRYLLGNDDIFQNTRHLKYSMESFSKNGCGIISKKIKYLFNNIKKNIPSGRKITSKYGYFRIKPQGEKIKGIELPNGEINYIYGRNISKYE